MHEQGKGLLDSQAVRVLVHACACAVDCIRIHARIKAHGVLPMHALANPAGEFNQLFRRGCKPTPLEWDKRLSLYAKPLKNKVLQYGVVDLFFMLQLYIRKLEGYDEKT